MKRARVLSFSCKSALWSVFSAGLFLIAACDAPTTPSSPTNSTSPSVPAPSPLAVSGDLAQIPAPPIDVKATKKLFEALSGKSLGNSRYDIRLSKNGIEVVPGADETRAKFALDDTGLNGKTLVAFVVLPEACLPNPGAGIAGVELFADGKSLGRQVVDRFKAASFPLNSKKIRTLEIVSDSANKTPLCDHLFVAIRE